MWVKNPTASTVIIRGHHAGTLVPLATLLPNQNWTFVTFTFTPATGPRKIGF